MFPKKYDGMACVASLCVIYLLLFLSIQWNAFSRDFYAQQESSLHLAASIGMSSDDYNKGMARVLNYLEGKENTIDVTITIHKQSKQLFNDKEKEHMVDVKGLYLNARTVAMGAFALVIVTFALLCYKYRKDSIYLWSIAFKKTALGFMVFFAFAAFYAIIDFNAFWNTFHGIFFSNDLWQLNPYTDNMILMLPESLFSDLVLRISAQFVFTFAFLLTLSIWYKKRSNRVKT